MTDFKKIDDVRAIQSNMRACFGSAQGNEVMRFLEEICGWYDFSENDPDKILIKHGKRQVLATIKTILECSSEQIVNVAMAQDS